MNDSIAFREFAGYKGQFGTGGDHPAGWCSLAEVDLLILVGVTGVGKSTTVAELISHDPSIILLPDRRTLTDVLIIRYIQQLDGLPAAVVKDRSERFDFTRQYRTLFPGGMSHALSNVLTAPNLAGKLFLFDGLRGANEVEHAAALLPQARFIFLGAPDGIRIQRLLARQDEFDTVAKVTPRQIGEARSPESRQIDTLPVWDELFPDCEDLAIQTDEREWILSRLRKGVLTAEDVNAKLTIVRAERRNYDPEATLNALRRVAVDRLFVVDTVQLTPQESVQQIWHWISNQNHEESTDYGR